MWGLFLGVANGRRKYFELDSDFNYFGGIMARNKIVLIFLAFVLCPIFIESAYAIDDDDWFRNREITLQQNREDYARRVYGSARHAYEKAGDPNFSLDGNSKTKTAIKHIVVEDNPSKTKVGKPALERIKAFGKGTIPGFVGAAALTALIEGVGWVMEEGTYVKYKDPEDDDSLPNIPKVYSYTCNGITYHATAEAMKSCALADIQRRFPDIFETVRIDPISPASSTSRLYLCRNAKNGGTCNSYPYSYVDNPAYEPDKPEPEREKIPLTPELLGGMMLGDYQDPVSDIYNITNNYYDNSVTSVYEHDSSGIGNEVAQEMDDRIKNAAPTSDGKPAPIGDSRYKNAPAEDTKSNDRSWTDDTAGDAEGGTTPIVDPETGEKVGDSISLSFPVFCTWAFKMCEWYDNWKKTDVVVREHIKEEKTFWQSIKELFTFVKTDDTDKDTNLDIEQDSPLDIDTSINFGGQCPAPITYKFSYHNSSQEFGITDFSPFCSMLSSIFKPIVIAMSSFIAVLIISGVRTNE